MSFDEWLGLLMTEMRTKNAYRCSKDCFSIVGAPDARYVSLRYASPAVVSEAGKQKTTPRDRSDSLICLKKIGAGEGIRTLDPDLGKVVLYP